MTVFDYYIPPDVSVNTDGTIAQKDWPKVYRFENGADRFVISSAGFGMPAIDYVSQSGPEQDGETLLNYKLQPRYIQVIHRRNACNVEDYWDNRADILNWLRPNRQTPNVFAMGRLRKVYPGGRTRDIYAIIQQGPEFAPKSGAGWDEWSFTETLRFRCPDPIFFDPVRSSLIWELEQFGGLIFYDSPSWEDHLTFPVVFGTDAIQGTQSITYTGTWKSFPIIYIDGPLSCLVITNSTTGKRIALTYNIANGEQVTIDTMYGNKTIVNSAGDSLIGTLTNDSDMDFYIAPDPEAVGGVNALTVSGNNGVFGTTAIRLTYYSRYIGL